VRQPSAKITVEHGAYNTYDISLRNEEVDSHMTQNLTLTHFTTDSAIRTSPLWRPMGQSPRERLRSRQWAAKPTEQEFSALPLRPS